MRCGGVGVTRDFIVQRATARLTGVGVCCTHVRRVPHIAGRVHTQWGWGVAIEIERAIKKSARFC